jgi:hypothetical protein
MAIPNVFMGIRRPPARSARFEPLFGGLEVVPDLHIEIELGCAPGETTKA